jgi:WD40 repeat protein
MRLLFVIAFAFLSAGPVLGQEGKPTEVINFKDHIAPILRKHCGNCHNADEAKSDLNLMTYQTAMTGGSSGAAITPGSSQQSLLYRLVSHQDEPTMPPGKKKVPDQDISLIAKWLDGGAPETAVSAARMSARKTDMDLSSVTQEKPQGTGPMPVSLPEFELPETIRPAAVTALDASPWAPLVAVSGHECILLYNTDTLEFIGGLPFSEGVVHSLRFSRDGEVLLAAGGRGAEHGIVVLFDVRSGERIAEIGEEIDSVLTADISPNKSLVALGGTDKLVKVFEVKTGKQLYEIKKHTDWITAMEFSPDGNYLASGDRNGGVFVWEANSGGIEFTLGDHKEMITQVSWRADSQMLATASEDGRMILWFAEDGFPYRSATPHASSKDLRDNPKLKVPGVLSVSFSKNGDLMTSGRDLTAKLWTKSGSRNEASFDGFAKLPTRVCFSHDGRYAITGDLAGNLQAWDIKKKELAGKLTPAL